MAVKPPGVFLPQSVLEARVQELVAEREIILAKLDEYAAANKQMYDRFQDHIRVDAIMAFKALPESRTVAAMRGADVKSDQERAQRSRERSNGGVRPQGQPAKKGASGRRRRR